jgi:hypothetical protein
MFLKLILQITQNLRSAKAAKKIEKRAKTPKMQKTLQNLKHAPKNQSFNKNQTKKHQ